jgi:hypothetical protein
MPNSKQKRKLPQDLKSLARAYTTLSVDTLSGVAQAGTSEAARVAAAIALLDRGWGKPNQPTETKLDGKVEIVLRDIALEIRNKKP